ncbi:MAG: nucleotidyltransferase family protein [Planctomycetota bacterium]|nr:nucleotidyltransferase family protein [Planctomycetota bacterium]
MNAADDGARLLDVLRGNAPADLTPDRLDPLLPLAAAHGLVGVVYEALLRHPNAFPEWKRAADEIEVTTRLQLKAAEELAAALDDKKVDAVFVKGVALALSVYPRLGLRSFSDLDLLMQPESVRDAHAVLTQLGFAMRDEPPGSIEVGYVREKLPGFRVCIDLHWDFTAADSVQAAVRIPVAEVLRRRRTVKNIPIPADEDSLLLAAANLARKTVEPVMLVVDFARLIGRPLEWERVGECASTWGLRTPLWLGMTLAGKLLAAPAPAPVLETITPPKWRADWLESMLAGEQLWQSGKHEAWRYRLLFKLLCLDSWWHVLPMLTAVPRNLLRKAGLSGAPSGRLLLQPRG